MAFEKINIYTNSLLAEYQKLETKINLHQEKVERDKLRAQQRGIFDAMILYHQSVLKMAKFQSQRIHMEDVLRKIQPAFCIGYLH